MSFEKVKNKLETLGYTVSVFENGEKAAEYLNMQIDGKTVSIGGSVTAKQLGLYESLSRHNEVWSHSDLPVGMTVRDVIARERNTDVYIASANGLSEQGEIINIDGTCNRVADIFYGHGKVYLVIGKNKLAPDCDSALFRARNIAAPLNAKRLNKQTPCAKSADRCYNCNSPERICRGLTVLWRKPTSCDYEIVLVNEDLGY